MFLPWLLTHAGDISVFWGGSKKGWFVEKRGLGLQRAALQSSSLLIVVGGTADSIRTSVINEK